jgi:hypothetical protein
VGIIGRLFRRKSESEKVRQLGEVLAEGFREGLKNPPRTEAEREELYRRLFVEGHRFPTLEEIDAELWRRIRDQTKEE